MATVAVSLSDLIEGIRCILDAFKSNIRDNCYRYRYLFSSVVISLSVLFYFDLKSKSIKVINLIMANYVYSHREMADMVFMYGWARGDANQARRLYADHFPRRNTPNRKTFERVYRRLQENGMFSMTTVNRGAPRTVRNVALEEEILRRVENNSQISIRTIANELHVSVDTVWQVLHTENLYPYHFQRVQALMRGDFAPRMQFCQWFERKIDANPNFVSSFFFTDEAQFDRKGVFNFHNQHTWARENPHAIIQSNHQHRFSLNVWGGIIGDNLIGPHFFPGTLTGPVYRDFLQNDLETMLEDVPLATIQNMWFMHDGAPPHFSITARRYLNRKFPNHWVGRGGPTPWPPRSPDLNAMDYYFWGHLKQIVYATPVDSIDDLRAKIVIGFEQIRNMSGVFQRIRQSMQRRVRACILSDGGHFQHLL